MEYHNYKRQFIARKTAAKVGKRENTAGIMAVGAGGSTANVVSSCQLYRSAGRDQNNDHRRI
jgi:hypothetical protein